MTAEDTEANKQLTSVQMTVRIGALTIQILLPVMYFTMFLGTLTISNLGPQPESVRHEGVLHRLAYCSLVHLAMARRTSSHCSCLGKLTSDRMSCYIHND